MGMSTSAYLFFGVDLKSNEEYPQRYEFSDELQELIDEDWYAVMDNMVEEFVGWTEIDLSVHDDGWLEQHRRKQALIKSVGIGYGSYGYDYRENYIHVGPEASCHDGCDIVNFSEEKDVIDQSFDNKPTIEHIETLQRFLDFLDTKGFHVLPG
jgi:hypothetical protein